MMDVVLAAIFDGRQAICQKQEYLKNCIKYAVILSNYTKPSPSAHGQPLWMAVHASDWGDYLIQRHKGANGYSS